MYKIIFLLDGEEEYRNYNNFEECLRLPNIIKIYEDRELIFKFKKNKISYFNFWSKLSINTLEKVISIDDKYFENANRDKKLAEHQLSILKNKKCDTIQLYGLYKNLNYPENIKWGSSTIYRLEKSNIGLFDLLDEINLKNFKKIRLNIFLSSEYLWILDIDDDNFCYLKG